MKISNLLEEVKSLFDREDEISDPDIDIKNILSNIKKQLEQLEIKNKEKLLNEIRDLRSLEEKFDLLVDSLSRTP